MFDYNKFFTEHPVNIHDQPERHSLIASLCKGSVLDIGCGTGSLSDYYTGSYCGIDISDVAIKKAVENRRKTANFLVADFTKPFNLDFSKYNTIVLAEFLEHINDDKLLFDEIDNSVKKGTKIIVSVPNGGMVQSPDHVREFTAIELKRKLSNYGTVKFYDWIGADRRLVASVKVGCREPQILTGAIIAKNEAVGIEHALNSMLPFCDKIVVGVDSKTTDKTKDIAKKYADDVFTFEWQDDFSEARNNLAKRVSTKWIFWLDGHEYIEIGPNRDFLIKTNCDSIMCQNRLDNGSIVRFPRLHHSKLRYIDKVHNNLQSNKICTSENILLVHNRVGGQSAESIKEREAQRDKMVVGIMGKQLIKNRGNTRASFHLGLHYHARREYKKAIKCYKLYLRFSKNAGERWYIRFNLALLQMSLGHLIRAERNCYLLEKESPGRWETKHIYGMVLFAKKKYFSAIEYFVSSFENKKQEADYKPLVRNTSITWNMVGECFFNLHKLAEAQSAFDRASSLSTDPVAKDIFRKRANLMLEMLKINK